MKKIFTIVTAAVLLLTSSLVTSCSSEDLESLAPSNTWCEMPIDWDDDGASNLYLSIIYNDTTLTGTSGSSNLKSDFTCEPGITMVLFAKAEVKSLGLTAGTYTTKTFAKSKAESLEDISFKGSRAEWAAIYWSKAPLRDPNTQNIHPKAPAAITNGSSYTKIDDLTDGKEAWKKLLKQFLLNTL